MKFKHHSSYNSQLDYVIDWKAFYCQCFDVAFGKSTLKFRGIFSISINQRKHFALKKELSQSKNSSWPNKIEFPFIIRTWIFSKRFHKAPHSNAPFELLLLPFQFSIQREKGSIFPNISRVLRIFGASPKFYTDIFVRYFWYVSSR